LEKISKKYSEVKPFVLRCTKALQNIVVNCQGNEVLFREEIEKKMNHYCNDHSKCNNPSNCNKSIGITSSVDQEAFKVLIFLQFLIIKGNMDEICRDL